MSLFSGSNHVIAEKFEALLTDMTGTVQVRFGKNQEWIKQEIGMNLEQHDLIRTGENSFAEITIDGKGMFSLEEKSALLVGELERQNNWFKLESGTLLFKIANLLKPQEKLNLHTRTSIAGIRGTEGAIEVLDETNTHMGLFEGNMEVYSIDKKGKRLYESVFLKPGFQTNIEYLKQPAKPYSLKKRMIKHKKKMAKLRTRLSQVRKKWRKIQKKRSRKIRSKINKRLRRKRPGIRPKHPKKR